MILIISWIVAYAMSMFFVGIVNSNLIMYQGLESFLITSLVISIPFLYLIKYIYESGEEEENEI